MSAPKMITQALATVVFTMFAAVAWGQQYGSPVDVETARKIAAAAVAEAKANKWKVAVTVVDTHGSLVFFERIDDTQIASLQISIDKARTAARFRRPTRVWEDAMAKGRIAVMTLSGVVASPGGVPIVSGGKVIGAVGVSGATGDQDEQCAKAGVAAM